MTRALRRILLSLGILLYHLGLSRFLLRLNRRSPRVLLYHACEESESAFIRGLGSNTRPADFGRQLDFLKQHYHVIPLRQLEQGPRPDNAAVITFDDGYRSVYLNAFPRLKQRGLPATVYLVSRVVGNRELVWVNALMWLLHNHAATSVPIAQAQLGVPAECREPLDIQRYVQQHFDAEAVARTLAVLFEAAGLEAGAVAHEAALYVTEDEVREMAQHDITFGNHTASHPNLACLKPGEQHAEMREGLAAVKALNGLASLAYPFGEFTADSRAAAEATGHSSVMLVGGVNSPLDLQAVARVPVNARSTAGFFAELEVVTPVLALLKRLLNR